MEENNYKESSTKDVFPRVLVLSFNCFLSSGANGRTLQNLFYGWNKDCLAQIYMANEVPDFAGCSKYYRVTDSEALKALFGKRVGGTIVPNESKAYRTGSIYGVIKKKRQNQALRYFRQLVWETNRWQNKAFWDWIDLFNPDVILLFSGNNAFIDKIAWEISNTKSIPIILYNCEDYYLKGPKYNSFFARLNKRHNDKAFEYTMSVVKGVIYNSDMIMNSYISVFGKHNSTVIYNPASEAISHMLGRFDKDNTVAYLGNIAIGRDSSLIDVARELKKYELPLHIYGSFASNNSKARLLNEENVIYHGKISYDECVAIMCRCRLLVHCESFLPKNSSDLRHAFSTKIADSLASGTCLLVYAPRGIALTEYLIKNGSAIVASSKSELVSALPRALSSGAKEIIINALKTATTNHNIEKSALRTKTFLIKATDRS